jgi:hypothetical protein
MIEYPSNGNEMTKPPEFPHSQFPVRLEHQEGKEMKDKKVCFFQDKKHMQKYLDSSNLKKTQYSVFYKEDYV